MPRNNAEPKPKFLFTSDAKVKINIEIPKKISNFISQYQAFHKEVSGEDASRNALVAVMLENALASDKNFVKWRKAEAEKKAADVAVAQSVSVNAETSESRKEVSAEAKNVKNKTKKKTNINLKKK